MSKYGGSIHRAMDDNSLRKCKLSSCQERRWRISGYCQKHSRGIQKWGHPCGHNINDRELTNAFDQVSAVIDKNQSHKGIQEAVRFFHVWMASANLQASMERPQIPTARHMARLYDAHVNPLDLLKVCASVWLFHSQNMRSGDGIYSDEHCRAVMGHKVLKFVPISAKSYVVDYPRGKHRKAAGRYIQKHIGTLLVNITETIMQQEEQRQSRLRAMGSLLEI